MSRPFPLQDDFAERTCTLGYIQQSLGTLGMSDKRMVIYVTQLIADHGFPRPMPCALRGMKGTTIQPTPRSRWLRLAVDTWLGDYMPPEAHAALEARAHARAAAAMDTAAQALGRGPLRVVHSA